jgi:hypothetical protein
MGQLAEAAAQLADREDLAEIVGVRPERIRGGEDEPARAVDARAHP